MLLNYVPKDKRFMDPKPGYSSLFIRILNTCPREICIKTLIVEANNGRDRLEQYDFAELRSHIRAGDSTRCEIRWSDEMLRNMDIRRIVITDYGGKKYIFDARKYLPMPEPISDKEIGDLNKPDKRTHKFKKQRRELRELLQKIRK
jgi:hypothetical protein